MEELRKEKKVIWSPQPKQIEFMQRPEYEAFYGGAAGGGKSDSLLMEALRQVNIPHYKGLIIRKTYPELSELIDKSLRFYGAAFPKAKYNGSEHVWKFPSGAKIYFGSLHHAKDKIKYQGKEFDFIGFDELTHFTEQQFWYMMSRNRSSSGIAGYIRATCNPDADSWVASFISWWWDENTGYPIPERSGVIRYFIRRDGEIKWASSEKELCEKYGNWKIRPAAGLFFQRSQIPDDGWLDEIPADVSIWVRAWDLAATAESEGGEPAYTAGVLIGKRRSNGRYVIADVTNKRLAADAARQHIKATAIMDKQRKGSSMKIRLPQDPGQAGKAQAADFVKFLTGFNVSIELESGSKETRAEPFAAQWQHGNVEIVKGEWNESYLNQLESFPEGKFKDMVDASSSGFNELTKSNITSLPPITGSLGRQSYWKR